MHSVRPQQRGLVTRAVEEALEAVTSPPVRDSVIARALRDARRSSIPERGPEVLEFADGPLARALSDRVGSDVATEVLSQIRPLLERASMRPSLRALPRATAPAAGADAPEEESGVYVAGPRSPTDPAPGAPLPIVYLASRDADAAVTLALALAGAATVRVVEGLLEVLDALDEDEDAPRVLVLDATRPAVQLHSLVTVAPEIAGRAKVVVWRAVIEDRQAIAAAPVSTTAWVRCPSGAVADLARACHAALDPELE